MRKPRISVHKAHCSGYGAAHCSSRPLSCWRRRCPQCIHQLAPIGAVIEELRFAADSLLEEAGFELPVPLAIGALRTPKIAREL
jgi:hypothetical protein